MKHAGWMVAVFALAVSACGTGSGSDKADIALSCRSNGMSVDLNLCMSGSSPGELKIKSGEDVKTYTPSDFLRFGDSQNFSVPRLDYELFVRANEQVDSVLRVEITRKDGSTIQTSELTQGDAIHVGSSANQTF